MECEWSFKQNFHNNLSLSLKSFDEKLIASSRLRYFQFYFSLKILSIVSTFCLFVFHSSHVLVALKFEFVSSASTALFPKFQTLRQFPLFSTFHLFLHLTCLLCAKVESLDQTRFASLLLLMLMRECAKRRKSDSESRDSLWSKCTLLADVSRNLAWYFNKKINFILQSIGGFTTFGGGNYKLALVVCFSTRMRLGSIPYSMKLIRRNTFNLSPM